MDFNDWTAKAVEHRILEMADTIRKLPAVKGPKAFGSAIPEVVRKQSEAYGSNRPRYREAASASQLARMTPLPNELGVPAMFAGTFKNTSRQAFAKGPGSAIKIGAAETTTKTLTSSGRFEMGVEASGAQVGINRLIGAAFYRGNLTSTELETEVYAQFAEFQTAVSSGLTF